MRAPYLPFDSAGINSTHQDRDGAASCVSVKKAAITHAAAKEVAAGAPERGLPNGTEAAAGKSTAQAADNRPSTVPDSCCQASSMNIPSAATLDAFTINKKQISQLPEQDAIQEEQQSLPTTKAGKGGIQACESTAIANGKEEAPAGEPAQDKLPSQCSNPAKPSADCAPEEKPRVPKWMLCDNPVMKLKKKGKPPAEKPAEPDKKGPPKPPADEKALAGTRWCKDSNTEVSGGNSAMHLRCAKHLKKTSPLASTAENRAFAQAGSGHLYCNLCGTKGMSKASFRMHCQGRKHVTAMIQATTLKSVQKPRKNAYQRAGYKMPENMLRSFQTMAAIASHSKPSILQEAPPRSRAAPEQRAPIAPGSLSDEEELEALTALLLPDSLAPQAKASAGKGAAVKDKLGSTQPPAYRPFGIRAPAFPWPTQPSPPAARHVHPQTPWPDSPPLAPQNLHPSTQFVPSQATQPGGSRQGPGASSTAPHMGTRLHQEREAEFGGNLNVEQAGSLTGSLVSQSDVASDEVLAALEGIDQDLEFLITCPITQDIMVEPVLLSDGFTYERSWIAAWLDGHNTSPMTNLELQSKEMMPNLLVKEIIRKLLRHQEEK